MALKDIEILSEWMSVLMANNKREPFDIAALSPEYRKLGGMIQRLSENMWELNEYSMALSTGDLTIPFPPPQNYLCTALKNLHANLNHLTWQVNQVAQGDYSQQVLYLGEYSDAFNTMISQLKEREELSRKIAEEKEHKAQVLEAFYELFISLMKNRKEWIYVVDMEKEKVLYFNKELEPIKEFPQAGVSVNLIIMLWKNDNRRGNASREIRDSKNGRSYFVRAFDVNWRGQKATAFMVEDVTVEREAERRLSDLAYKDTFTGIYNRRYLLESLENLIRAGAHFSCCYLDINHLKQVNDTFGHAEGDRYIQQIVELIQNGIRQSDIFARIGGDEFCVLLLKCPKEVAENKMDFLYRKALNLSGGREDYEVSFSYGIIEAGGRAEGTMEYTVESILQEADKAMYQFKTSIKG